MFVLKPLFSSNLYQIKDIDTLLKCDFLFDSIGLVEEDNIYFFNFLKDLDIDIFFSLGGTPLFLMVNCLKTNDLKTFKKIYEKTQYKHDMLIHYALTGYNKNIITYMLLNGFVFKIQHFNSLIYQVVRKNDYSYLTFLKEKGVIFPSNLIRLLNSNLDIPKDKKERIYNILCKKEAI